MAKLKPHHVVLGMQITNVSGFRKLSHVPRNGVICREPVVQLFLAGVKHPLHNDLFRNHFEPRQILRYRNIRPVA